MTHKGRIYGCIEHVLKPEIASGERRPSGHERGFYYETFDDYLEIGRPIIGVRNGAWVLDTSDRFSYPGGGYWLVGASHEEVSGVVLDATRGLPRRLYICHKPFGFVAASKIDRTTVDGQPAGDMHLDCAEQIHKGELGRTVPIIRPPYIRSRKGRKEYGWVRLGDLGDASGAYNLNQLIELILGYWSFGGHEHYWRGRPIGQLIDFIEDDHPDLRDEFPRSISLSRAEFVALASEDPSSMWLRRGFAFTILRLLALGVQPEVLQYA